MKQEADNVVDVKTQQVTKTPIIVCTKLWRHVHVMGWHRKEITYYTPAQQTQRGTFLMRCLPANMGVTPDTLCAFVPALSQHLGMVVFLKEQLPKDWTYILVTGISAKGNAVFGRAFCGSYDELLSQYRSE